MKDLLVRRVGGAPNRTIQLAAAAEVLDVGQHHVGELAIVLVVLAAQLGRNVRGHAGVDDEVLLARVLVWSQAADDEETVALVQLGGEAAELCVQSWEGKGVGADMTSRQVESYNSSTFPLSISGNNFIWHTYT